LANYPDSTIKKGWTSYKDQH